MLQKLTQAVIGVFKYHKLKIFAAIFSFVIFLFLIFPFDDLSGLVTTQVAELTKNQVFLEFDQLGFSLYPQLGFELKNVRVESPFTPPLSAGSLSVAPSLWGLLSLNPGVALHAEDFLGGEVSFSTRPGKKSESGQIPQKFSLEANQINLKQILEFAQLAFSANGKMDLELDGKFDPSLVDQPSGEFEVELSKVFIAENTVKTPLGPLDLPSLKLKKVKMLGHLKKNDLKIKTLQIGGSGDQLHAKIKGRIDIRVVRIGRRLSVSPGGYDFRIELNIKSRLRRKFPFLQLLKDYQVGSSKGGIDYGLKVSAPQFNSTPKIQRL